MTEIELVIKSFLEESRSLIPEGDRKLLGKFEVDNAEYTYRLTTREGTIDTDELRIIRRKR